MDAQIASGSEHDQNVFLRAISEGKTALHEQQLTAETAASAWFDVTYYRLALEIFTQPNYLQGKVTIAGICRKDNERSLTLDLVNNMRVDSVLMDGQTSLFLQHSSSFDITLSRPTTLSETLSVDVYYDGVPITTGLGSFYFDSHAGVPWVYSLSEPYGAKDWWPCKDDPSDKADSADIIITCDSTFKVGSEGILASVINNGDGTSTHVWKERYPIASYLISVAITNYVQFSNWFRYSGTDSMEVLNYVLPEHESTALQNLPRVVDMLAIYSDLFGLYPFIKEKYGHAEFGRGGAMEHQTMTSTTTFDELTISHELAHQWFGDMITCQSWSDLWLNEGFAEYSSALYLERRYGTDSYWTYMNQQFDAARTTQGIVGHPDTTDVRILFNQALVYSKGASVLHMLRHVLGDSVFFHALRMYAQDPAVQYRTATTRDFQTVCENVSGKNLGYFFQEWIYGEEYPVYNYSWTWKSLGDSSVIILDVGQINSRSNPVFFSMPIDIRITAAGWDTTMVVFNDMQQQRFILQCNKKPSEVLLDPNKWILKYARYNKDQLPSEVVLEQNYPNPFNSSTTIIYELRRQGNVTLKIYDVLGREIATLVNARQSPGLHESQWIPLNCVSGIYFYRLRTGDVTLQKKMVFLK